MGSKSILENNTSLVLFLIILFFTISLFAAPYTIEIGSIRNLDGNANWIDYSDKWNNINIFARTIYYIGDLNCHQKFNRSLVLNENQMPVCARDTGIFLGMNIGFIISFFVTPNSNLFKTAIQYFPKKFHKIKRKKILIISAGLLFIMPVGIDGFLQLLTNYESTNSIRLLTGFPAGVALSCVIVSSIISILQQKKEKR